MKRLCVHAVVSGKVQGVGFRQATEQEAERLEVDGWVRNLEDGQVEVLLEGEEDAVRALATWLECGPRHARVKAVVASELTVQGIVGFVVRR